MLDRFPLVIVTHDTRIFILAPRPFAPPLLECSQEPNTKHCCRALQCSTGSGVGALFFLVIVET